MGLFSSLRMGASALRAQQTGIQVTGQNLANVNTDGYTRQRAHMSAISAPQGASPPLAGRGVEVQRIARQVDEYLVSAIRNQGSSLQSLEERDRIMQQVEGILNELGDNDLSSGMDAFFSAVQEWSSNPQDSGLREGVLQSASLLSQRFNSLGTQLTDLRTNVNAEVSSSVDQINVLTSRIANLNRGIVSLESGHEVINGRNANDLRDQRDEALRQLAEIVNISVSEQSTGSVTVSISGDYVVMDGKARAVELSQEVVDGVQVSTPIFTDNLVPLNLRSGRLHGLLEARDTLVTDVIDDLDTLANAFMSEVNAIQTTGYGLQGYSTLTSWETPSVATNVALNQSGLSRSVANGAFVIQVRNANNGTVTPVQIQIDADGIGFDTTLESLRDEINADMTAAGFTNITASINADGRLVMASSDTSLTFSFTGDSSGALHTLGWGAMFHGDGARGMSINALLEGNTDFLAGGTTTAVADNTNILNLVSLRSTGVLAGNSQTLEEFYRGVVGNVGTNTARLHDTAANQQAVVSSLENERQSVSGVNVDEEIVNLMTYQRAFQGAARYIGVVDELLDTLINGL